MATTTSGALTLAIDRMGETVSETIAASLSFGGEIPPELEFARIDEAGLRTPLVSFTFDELVLLLSFLNSSVVRGVMDDEGELI